MEFQTINAKSAIDHGVTWPFGEPKLLEKGCAICFLADQMGTL